MRGSSCACARNCACAGVWESKLPPVLRVEQGFGNQAATKSIGSERGEAAGFKARTREEVVTHTWCTRTEPRAHSGPPPDHPTCRASSSFLKLASSSAPSRVRPSAAEAVGAARSPDQLQPLQPLGVRWDLPATSAGAGMGAEDASSSSEVARDRGRRWVTPCPPPRACWPPALLTTS